MTCARYSCPIAFEYLKNLFVVVRAPRNWPPGGRDHKASMPVRNLTIEHEFDSSPLSIVSRVPARRYLSTLDLAATCRLRAKL